MHKKTKKNVYLGIFIVLFIVILIVILKMNSKEILTNIETATMPQEQTNNIIDNNAILQIGNITNAILNKTINSENKLNENTSSDQEELKENINLDKEETQKSDNSNKEISNINKDNNASSENVNSNYPTGKTPYYIKVNCGAQVVTIYKKDSSGNYTVPFKAMICSTGTSTPKSGVYEIPGRWNWGGLVGNVYGQYITVITGQILFHSVPYLERYNPGSLEYEEYDKLGTAASAGCVRLTVEDALWIWNNCENGTKVEFYSSNNPGPSGKPTAKKISNAEGDLKNWDPTDPNKNNPWNKKSENTVDNNKNNTTTNTINTINNTNNINIMNNNLQNKIVE